MLRIAAMTAALLFAAPAIAQGPPSDPKEMKAQVLLADLFIAITNKDSAGVSEALKNGANVNGRNWLGIPPLMWASMKGDNGIVSLLIARGAKLNDPTIYGSAASFASIGRNPKTASYLLVKGCSSGKRLDGASVLMLAAADNQVDVISNLLAKKASPNEKDLDGATPLIYAARQGHLPAMKQLVTAGAKVNTADSHGRTALSYAAGNGHAAAVDYLISKRADVNVRDKQKATPLLLAARYNGDSAIIRSLTAAKADRTAKDMFGKTALDLAIAREYHSAARLLKTSGVKQVSFTEAGAPSVRQAVQRGINAVQTGMGAFAKSAQCSSCHHQGLGLTAVAQAKRSGFQVDDAVFGRYMKQLETEGKQMGPAIHQALSNPQVGKLLPGVDIGDFSIAISYMFGSLVAVGVPANPGLGEAAQFLASLQEKNGSWKHGFERGPMQYSYVLTTALALQILRTYGAEDQLKPTFEKSRTYLASAPMKTTEDLAGRLLGLKWAGAESADIEKAAKALLAAQKVDGGWTSAPTKRSDAFGTGLALYALHIGGGMKAGDAAYQRGVRYLVRTQDEDGSWYVNKTTQPANNYFHAGFSHGQSQYSSFAGTSWAAMALMPAAEQPQTASR